MLSTLKKRKSDLDLEQGRKKLRKGFGYALSLKLWVCKHFVFNKGSFVATEEIIEAYKEEKGKENSTNISKNAIGRIVMDLWGSEGVRQKTVGKRGEKPLHGYYNLGFAERNYIEPQGRLLTIDDLQAELQSTLSNQWTIVRNSDQSISILKNEIISFNGQRSSIELLVTGTGTLDGNFKLQILRQNFRVPVEKLKLDKQINSISTLESINVLTRFIDSSSLCSGFEVVDESKMSKGRPDTTVTYRVGLVSSEKEDQDNVRMFSGKCTIFAPAEGQCCSACGMAKKNENLKNKRRSSVACSGLKERFLTEEGMRKKLEAQRRQLRNCRAREERWRKKYEEQLIVMEEMDHLDLKSIMDNNGTKNVPEDMLMFWEQQKRIIQTPNKKGYRWHPKIVKLCLELYCKNPHVLDPLRKVMCLPSNRTIRLYKNKREQQPGWHENIVEWCHQQAKERKLKECDYWGGFVIDEMKLEENVEMVVKNGKHKLVGFVNLGSLHDDMEKLEGKDEIQLASHVLQFVFLSDCGFRFPIAQFASHDCTPSDLFFLFWEGVLMMKEFGFTIYWCILDGAECNRKFIQMHFPEYDAVSHKFVAFNMHTGGHMVFIVDCKHNFKKIRNNLEKSNIYGKPRLLTVSGKRILWEQFKAAYEFDQNNTSIHIHEKLTEAHFNLDPALKMRNHLAEEVLDKRMLYLMVTYKRHLLKLGNDGNQLDAAIQLLEHTSCLIEFFSSSKQAIRSISDCRLKELDKFLMFLTKWQEEASSAKEFFSSKLWFDLQSMIHGFKSLVKIKLSVFPNSVVKAWIINQDVVENHFCEVRACNGQNNNPTYRLQESAQNSIRIGHQTISKKANAMISHS